MGNRAVGIPGHTFEASVAAWGWQPGGWVCTGDEDRELTREGLEVPWEEGAGHGRPGQGPGEGAVAWVRPGCIRKEGWIRSQVEGRMLLG